MMPRGCARSFLVLGIGVSACDAGDAPGGEFRCFDDPRCPAGSTCVGGACVPDGTPSSPCATVEQLAATFDTLPTWAREVEADGGQVGLDAGDLRLEVPSGAPDAEAGVKTAATYDLRGGGIVLEVTAVTRSATEIRLNDSLGTESFFGVRIATNELFVFLGTMPLRLRPYDPVADRWWRVREQDGTIFYATSPDGSMWTPFTNHKAFSPEYVYVTLRVKKDNVASGGIARFASINEGYDATQSFCKADTLRDSFDDGRSGPLWIDQSSAGCASSESGKLVFTSTGDAASVCRYSTTRPFDLRGVWLTAKVTPAAAPGVTRLELASDDAGHAVTMERGAAGLRLVARADGVSVLERTVAYVPNRHRYWRVGLAPDGRIHFAASPDGETFADLASVDAPGFDGRALTIDLSLGLTEAATGGVMATFEAFR